MPLSAEQLKSVQGWIESHSPVLSCLGCSEMEWAIQSELAFTSLIDPQGGQIDHGKGYPLVALTCKNCGYTVFFNAIQLGIVPGSPAKKTRAPRKKTTNTAG